MGPGPRVSGYVVADCTVVCNLCTTEKEKEQEGSPIFDDSDWDYVPTCERCGAELDVILTIEGERERMGRHYQRRGP